CGKWDWEPKNFFLVFDDDDDLFATALGNTFQGLKLPKIFGASRRGLKTQKNFGALRRVNECNISYSHIYLILFEQPPKPPQKPKNCEKTAKQSTRCKNRQMGLKTAKMAGNSRIWQHAVD
uniref:Uncharacterized protein n=1 Tax=Romanomermis culicivorax TaxID=13658 RepID=A0A915J8K8_ROMCU